MDYEWICENHLENNPTIKTEKPAKIEVEEAHVNKYQQEREF